MCAGDCGAQNRGERFTVIRFAGIGQGSGAPSAARHQRIEHSGRYSRFILAWARVAGIAQCQTEMTPCSKSCFSVHGRSSRMPLRYNLNWHFSDHEVLYRHSRNESKIMDPALASIRATHAVHELKGARSSLATCEAKLSGDKLSDAERAYWIDAKTSLLHKEETLKAELQALESYGGYPAPPPDGLRE